jgi:peptidoglycan/xylan/chitin deacetylase (PgdA/CDA1 family)
VTIVNYHGIVQEPLAVRDWSFLDARSFRRQIEYLKSHFDVIRLADAVDRMQAGEIRRPTAVITLDDGFQNNYDLAWPILREASVPATIFLVSGLIDTNKTVWFCYVHRAISETTRMALDWDGCRFDLGSAASRTRASEEIQLRLKDIGPAAQAAQLNAVLGALDDSVDRPVEQTSPYRMLSGNAVHEMAVSGLIDFGAHTQSHAIVSRLPDDECWREISGSIAAVAELTGQPCTLFAYPNGGAQDYDPRAISMAAASGVRTAVTTLPRRNERGTPPLELGRYWVGPHGIGDLSMAACGVTVQHHLSKLRPGMRLSPRR